MDTFKLSLKRIARGALDDYKTTHRHLGGKTMKFLAGSTAGSYFASASGTLPPLQWTLRRFGPLPFEFTKSGALRIFTMTGFQRLGAMTLVAASKFVVVTVAYEGGVVVGSIVNQFLSQETKDAIGGVIYNTIYEEGWKDLWRHPFGYGIYFGAKGERLIDY